MLVQERQRLAEQLREAGRQLGEEREARRALQRERDEARAELDVQRQVLRERSGVKVGSAEEQVAEELRGWQR